MANETTKLIEFRIILPGKSERRRFHAQPGHVYTQASVDEVLEKMEPELEARYPGTDFRLVELGFGRFNLVAETGYVSRSRALHRLDGAVLSGRDASPEPEA